MSSCLKRYSVRHEVNTLDACWITVDVWSNSSRCRKYRSTCLGHDAYIMIIALDIVMTLRGSINCSTVICSPTMILAILREASSEHYGPRVYSTPYFQPYSFSSLHFPPSHLTLQSILKGSTSSFVFAHVLWTWQDSPTGLIPWFSNWGKYLLLLCCITLSSSREKPTQASLR